MTRLPEKMEQKVVNTGNKDTTGGLE